MSERGKNGVRKHYQRTWRFNQGTAKGTLGLDAVPALFTASHCTREQPHRCCHRLVGQKSSVFALTLEMKTDLTQDVFGLDAAVFYFTASHYSANIGQRHELLHQICCPSQSRYCVRGDVGYRMDSSTSIQQPSIPASILPTAVCCTNL